MSDEVDVVRVTVDRREKDIQDYAGSATVLGGGDLERQGVKSVRDMASSTPYVEIGTQDGNTEIYMRGIGSNNNTELGDPATATHVDGIYIPRPRGVGSMFFDLERVEINRGPQGTLRGRNATAGSINMVTNKPKLGEFGGEASLQFGNYTQRLVKGMVNIPLGKTLAVRFAAFGEARDPFFKNGGPVYTLKPTEDANSLAYRASLKWVPSDKVTVTIMHDFTKESGAGWSGANFYPALAAGLLPEEVPDPRSIVLRGPQAVMSQTHVGVMGNLNIDLGPVIIDYSGSYRFLKYDQTSAGNAGVVFPGMPAPDLDDWSTSWFNTDSKSVIQELRFLAPDTARFRWSVGGFFFKEDQNTFFAQVGDKSWGWSGGEYTMPVMDSYSYAGFADGTFDITKMLRATAGVRITTESKRRTGIGYQYNFNYADGVKPVRLGTEGFRYAGRQGRTDFTPGGPGIDPSSPNSGIQDYLNGIAQFGARDQLPALIESGQATINTSGYNVQDGKYNDSFVDFRVGVDANLAPKHLVYAQFSTGHKSGGFNDQITWQEPQPDGSTIERSVAKEYKPEAVYATEVGSKNAFLDDKLTLNVSGFWYLYKDLQYQTVQQVAPCPDDNRSCGGSAVRYNAASSRILGLEADANWRLPAGFNMNLQGMLLDSRFTEGKVNDTRISWSAADQPEVNLKDNKLVRAPTLSLNYALSQAIPTDFGIFDWMVNTQFKSKYYMSVFNSEGYDTKGNFNPGLSDVVPAYVRFDAAVGWAKTEGDLRLDAFINNITDRAYMTSIITQPNLNLRFFNPPRQMGVRLTVYM